MLVQGWQVVKIIREQEKRNKEPRRPGLIASILKVLTGLLRKAA